MIFTLIKENDFKYKEVAEIMNISPKTVENQLAIALKKISVSINFDLVQNTSCYFRNRKLIHDSFFCIVQHSKRNIFWKSCKCFTGQRLGLVNPRLVIPVFISGQLMNKFHNNPSGNFRSLQFQDPGQWPGSPNQTRQKKD